MKNEIGYKTIFDELLWRADQLITVTHSDLNKSNIVLQTSKSYQLILLLNAAGATRVIGNNVRAVDGCELLLICPDVNCKWYGIPHISGRSRLISIAWKRELFESNMLKAKEFSFLREMLSSSGKAFLFHRETTEMLLHRIKEIKAEQGIYSVTELLLVLYEMASSGNIQALSDANRMPSPGPGRKDSRIVKALDFIDSNFAQPISLLDVAKMVHMSECGFSRYFKQKTGANFIDVLSRTRVEYAATLLTDSDKNISEISYESGFCNLSNFIRVFKKIKSCTPRDYRDKYSLNE